MHKKKIIIGNWKMNPESLKEAKKRFLEVKKEVIKYKNVQAVIAAPFVYLPELGKISSAGLALSAQNVSAEKEGAFTGEVSAKMLGGFKVKYCIVGHSERRTLGETNELINKKIKMALAENITPIVCVGETDREHGMWHLGIVKTQVEECFFGIPKASLPKIIVAYEPVWALSSTANRRDATAEDSAEMIIYIKKVLSDKFDAKSVEAVRVLYGGSVNETNAGEFLSAGKADGLLPGKASLTPKIFTSILKVANDIK